MRCLLFCVLLALTLPMTAQEHPNDGRGFSVAHAFTFDEIDHINEFNGHLSLAIPMGQEYPVNGPLSYGLMLSYNSSVWDFEERTVGTEIKNKGLPTRFSNAGMGWTLTLGRLFPSSDPLNRSTQWLLLSPDGGTNVLFPYLHANEITGDSTDDFYSRDNTYLRMKVSTREVEYPDGRKIKFAGDTMPYRLTDVYGNLVTIRYLNTAGQAVGYLDGTGQLVGDGRTGTIWELTDAHGRVQKVFFRTGMPYYGTIVDRVELTSFSIPGQAYAPATFTFVYTNQTIAEPCSDDDPETDPNRQVPLLTRILLPEGQTYEMPVASSYHTTNTLCDLSGTIKQVTIPMGGKIEWDYQYYELPHKIRGPQGYIDTSNVAGVSTRRYRDKNNALLSMWTYTTALTPEAFGNWKELKNTVTSPTGEVTEKYFSVYPQVIQSGGATLYEYGLPFTRKTADPNNPMLFLSSIVKKNNVTLRTNYVSYERDQTEGIDNRSGKQFSLNWRVLAARTYYNDDGTRFTAFTNSAFDGLGHYRQTDTTGNFDAANVRITRTEFNSARGVYKIDPATNAPAAGHTYTAWPLATKWVLGTFTFQQATEGSQVIRTDYCFDAEGFMARSRRLATGATRTSKDVVYLYTRDAVGNRVNSEVFGGDTQQTINTAQTDLCQLPLPLNTYGLRANQYHIQYTYTAGSVSRIQYREANTSIAGPLMSFASLDQDIDVNTGLAKTSRDKAGVATNYEYDKRGRLLAVKPAQSAHTKYVYALPTDPIYPAIDIYEYPNAGGAIALTRTQLRFDSFGRRWLERHLQPEGTWNRRETLYDAQGRVASISETVADSVPTPIPQKTSYEYDAFGRVTRATPPDCALHAVVTRYAGTRYIERDRMIGTGAGVPCVSGEVVATIKEHYDGQGRLWKVTEPIGSGVDTTYAYDPANRVTMMTSGVQTRSFSYDGRGFLTSMTQPENGTTVLTHDASSHVITRRIGTSNGKYDLTFIYDRAERLTAIRETGGGQRPLKTFTYAAANNGSDLANGKVRTAVRYNWIDRFVAAADNIETYYYAGRDGRVSQRDTTQEDYFTNNPSARSTKRFTQTFLWNDLGQPAELRFPNCIPPITYIDGTQQDCLNTVRTIALPDHIANPSNPSYRNGVLRYVPNMATMEFYPSGLLKQISHVGSGTTYIDQDDESNSMQRIRRIYTTGITPVFDTGTYEYDGAGNAREIGNATFTYDATSRLLQGNVFANGAAYPQNITYDQYGNVLSLDQNQKPRTFSVSSSTNRILTATYYDSYGNAVQGSVTYDEAGNVTQWAGYTFFYDSLSMLNGIAGAGIDNVFVYTADDERIRDYSNLGQYTTWRIRDLSGRVMREYVESSPWYFRTDWIHREDGLPLGDINFSFGSRVHYRLDHLGSTRGWGGISFNQYPYGELAPGTDGADLALEFTGHERRHFWSTPMQDVDNMHQRTYLPAFGRFLSVDDANGNLHFPQSWNRYAYVLGNPTNLVDPWGLKAAKRRLRDEKPKTDPKPGEDCPPEREGFDCFTVEGETSKTPELTPYGLAQLEWRIYKINSYLRLLRLRMPDYAVFTFTGGPYAGKVALDRYGRVYWAPLGFNLPPGGAPAASLEGGWMIKLGDTPAKEQLYGFMTEHGWSAGGAYWAAGGLAIVPNSGKGIELGAGTKSIGVNYGYSYEIRQLPIRW